MQCKECGDLARDNTLRYCENCGAKMPMPSPGGAPRRTGSRPALASGTRPSATRPALSGDAAREARRDTPVQGVVTRPPQPERPAYTGPLWLAPVPAHSPSVLGVGVLAAALVLSILPFFAGVGPFWSLVVFAGGWLMVARELRAVGERHPLVDWVPDSLLTPLLPALYAVVVGALAIRMLGIGITPVLWLGGAALVGVDQYRKVYVGEAGWSRYFEPRRLLAGLAPIALAGVTLCLLSLFLTWVPSRTSTFHRGAAAGPPGLRVMDQTPASSDVVYGLLDMPQDAGWDQPLSVFVELLLLGVLGVLALRPEVPRPDALRFAPVGVVLLGVAWMLYHATPSWGPVLFLVGLLATGFVVVYSAASRDI